MEIRKLNMLRGIAALVVVVSHYSNATNLFGGLLGKGAGHLGVMLFFMLSGFLMSLLYLDRVPTAANLRTFCIARIARVIPLYIATVLVSYALIKCGIAGIFYAVPDLYSLASHLLLLSGDSVLWTIPAEIHFYLLFTFFWWLHARHGAYLYVLMAALFTALYFLDFPDRMGKFAGFSIQTRLIHTLPFFLTGCALGHLYRHWQPPAYLRRNGFLLSLLLILLLFPGIFSQVFGFEHRMWRDVGLMLVMTIVFFCVVFLVPDDNALMSNVIGDFLGKVSYSLYLLHLPVLMLMLPLAIQSPLLLAPVFVAAALVVSWLSFVTMENPSRVRLRNFLERRAARP